MTTSAFVVASIDSISSDYITCNSGSCTGTFTSNIVNSNYGSFTGTVTTNNLQANNGIFATSVTVSGLPVRTDSLVGISALVEDANPTLSANLNANSKSVVNLDSLIANSAAFALNVSAGSINANSGAFAGNVGADSVTVNTGSFALGLTSGVVTANEGNFISSLTISGSPVAKANVPPMRLYLSTNPVTINNMPSNLNLYTNTTAVVQFADLTHMKEVRFFATQAISGASTARMRLNYSSSFQTTAVGYNEVLSTAGTNGGVELNINSANAVKDSGWLSLRNQAKGPIYLAVVVSGGDGSADPQFGPLIAEFR